MLKSLMSTLASPLTKYMGIAIVILIGALSSAMYLSYKFYGEKEVAAAANEQLSVAVEEEKSQTDKALKSIELTDEAVTKVRKGEKALNKATEKLKEKVFKPTPSNPTGDVKDEAESLTEPCDEYLSNDDVRLLKQSHCLTDGDPSNCSF